MIRRVRMTPAAERDLEVHADYLAQDSIRAALRFRAAVLSAFGTLAEMPGVGSTQRYRSPRLVGIRAWGVPNFRSYIIFYRVIGDTLEIIRILHGSRDLERALGDN